VVTEWSTSAGSGAIAAYSRRVVVEFIEITGHIWQAASALQSLPPAVRRFALGSCRVSAGPVAFLSSQKWLLMSGANRKFTQREHRLGVVLPPLAAERGEPMGA